MRIILAVDGSPSSETARDLVASLAWPQDTSITLLTAYSLPTGWMIDDAFVGNWVTEADDALQRTLQDDLTALAVPLRGRGWVPQTEIVLGRAAGAILSAAEAAKADLIVVGSRGHGTIGSMLLGSVSAEVADRASCSVLVARAPSVTNVLVATDGTECSLVAPGILPQWGVLRGLPATALSVATVDSPVFQLLSRLYALGQDPLAETRDRAVAEHQRYADEMADLLRTAGLSATAELRVGEPAKEIVAAAVAWFSAAWPATCSSTPTPPCSSAGSRPNGSAVWGTATCDLSG